MTNIGSPVCKALSTVRDAQNGFGKQGPQVVVRRERPLIALRYNTIHLKMQAPDNKAGIQQEDSQTERRTESLFEWWLGGEGEGAVEEEVIKGNKQTVGGAPSP